MARWEPDSLGRLEAAALALFAEQGFDRTTVAQIAQKAGFTERTFFNHFADKREVLFGLSLAFQEGILREIAGCGDTVPPLEAVVSALQTVGTEMFEQRRAAVTRRHGIIDANPELQERELRKYAALTEAIARALHQRGLDSEVALLTATAAMVVQQTALRRWMRPDENRTLGELLLDAQHSLRTAVT